MQLALGEVFLHNPEWGDEFRAGRVSFSGSAAFRRCFRNVRDMLGASWPDAFAIGQSECDERFAKGRAAMYLSGTWSLQTVAAVNPGMKIGLFPYPNSTGDARLVFEPNMTFMKSSKTSHSAEVDAVLDAIFGSARVGLGDTRFHEDRLSSSRPPIRKPNFLSRRILTATGPSLE